MLMDCMAMPMPMQQDGKGAHHEGGESEEDPAMRPQPSAEESLLQKAGGQQSPWSPLQISYAQHPC